MPKEVRYVLFSPDEVQDALVEGLSLADPSWKETVGAVRLDLAVAPSGEVLARLVARRTRAGRRGEWSFNAGDILAMLLQSCRRNRIPLPLRGHKRLELMATCLCLTITLGNAQVEPEVLLQEIRYMDPGLLPLLSRGF
jgi:hypothetical protein